MSALRNLQQSYDLATARLLVLMSALNDQGDDAASYSIEGQSMTKQTILDKIGLLQGQIRELKSLIQMEGGPFEVRSYGVPW